MVNMVLKRADGSQYDIEGKLYDSVDIDMVIDGYNAPITGKNENHFYMHMYAYTYIHSYTHTHTHTYIYIYIYICICIYSNSYITLYI